MQGLAGTGATSALASAACRRFRRLCRSALPLRLQVHASMGRIMMPTEIAQRGQMVWQAATNTSHLMGAGARATEWPTEAPTLGEVRLVGWKRTSTGPAAGT